MSEVIRKIDDIYAEYGEAQEATFSGFSKKFAEPFGEDKIEGSNNTLLSKHLALSFKSDATYRNNNILLIGDPGTVRRYFTVPNIFADINHVIVLPSSEDQTNRLVINALEGRGYDIRYIDGSRKPEDEDIAALDLEVFHEGRRAIIINAPSAEKMDKDIIVCWTVSASLSVIFNKLFEMAWDRKSRGDIGGRHIRFHLDSHTRIAGTDVNIIERITAAGKHNLSCAIVMSSFSKMQKIWGGRADNLAYVCDSLVFYGGVDEETRDFTANETGLPAEMLDSLGDDMCCVKIRMLKTLADQRLGVPDK